MNTITNRPNNHGQYTGDYCKQIFNSSDGEIINSYKCHQNQFTSADMWQIRSNKKETSIKAMVL